MSDSTESPRAGDPIPVDLLEGRYQLQGLIGRGGMGSVYRALDTRLGRLVAIKVLSDADGADPERFLGEVRTLARFAHANLVRLLDAGELGDRPYLVMELIDGPTLAQRLVTGPLSLAETARIATGVAGALAYVHEEGIVHRDVKPPNVLLDRRGDAHLADFGIARLVDTTGMTATGLTLGTPAYLSPEQVQGSPIGPPADIYALGLVLLECLTGRRAFEGTPAEVTAARLHRGPPIPASLPPQWRDLLDAMTARRPEDRIVAGEVVSRLGQVPVSGDTTVVGGEATAVMDDGPPAATAAMGAASLLATTRLQADGGDLPPTEVLPTQDPTVEPARPHRRVAAVAIGALVVLGLCLAAVFGAFSDANKSANRPAATTGSVAKPATTPATTVAPTTLAPTTTLPATTVPATTVPPTTLALDAAATQAGALVAQIEQGVANGAIASPAGQQLLAQLQGVLTAPGPQQQTQALAQLGMNFAQDVANGQISGSSTVSSLTGAIDSLASALGLAPPALSVPTTVAPAPAPGPPGGPGHGHGHH